VLGGALLIGGGTAVAQDATPGAIDLSPNPDQCTQAPRTLEELQAIAATPAPEATAIVDANQQPFVLPTGEPAPKEAIDGVVATIVQSIACQNAGNALAVFGGVTDGFLQSEIGADLLDPELIGIAAASPVALPEDQQTQLFDTREFTLYPDGRVGVLVYYKTPTPQQTGSEGPKIDLWIFKEVDGRWLVDETIVGLEDELGDMATPAAG
jgi:hypothetical protein